MEFQQHIINNEKYKYLEVSKANLQAQLEEKKSKREFYGKENQNSNG